MADQGWAGAWEPNIVGDGTLSELRDRAGEPVLMKNGKPFEFVVVSLKTGELRYPATVGDAR